MGGFTFAGEHSSTYHVRLLKSPLSILPGTRDKIITLSGRHGALRMLPDLGERHLSLECWLEAESITELHERAERVRAWLNPLRGEQQLILDSVPEKYYMAAYAGWGMGAEIVSQQGKFALDLVCADPFSYAVVPDIVTVTTSSYAHNQRGSAPAEPLFRLQGTSLGGAQRLTVQAGTQIVSYSGALATGDWLEIDCAAKTAVRVSGQTRTRVLHLLEKPIFPQLAPGFNSLVVAATGGASWSRLEVHCRNRWL
jgi:predicted phage tail component-like protein